MKVELDNEECWTLMSHVVTLLLEDTRLADADRARIRRWKSDEMRVSSQEMRVLTQKINETVVAELERKTKSQLRRPEWG